MRKKHQPAIDTRPPVAISLIRFSTPEQRKGDSVRRQTADTEAWCERNGVPLDQTFAGCGSAFKDEVNVVLAKFLELVKEGKVPRGSYLIIENLDRLSRQDERTALRLWLDILDSGVNIVQLHPETIFRHERSDMTDIIRAIIELSRGHSESRMKSVRTLANWDKATQLARSEGRTITSRLPAWVVLTDSGLQLIADRAVIVRRIYELASAGYGCGSIVKKLNAEKVPAFGGRVLDENGGTRAAAGDHYGCGSWQSVYVHNILSDRRAIGEFQPRDSSGRPKGEAIPGYYPAVVSEGEFYAARAATTARKNKGCDASVAVNRQGAIGRGVANLFGGLLRNARDGGTYYAASRIDSGARVKVLINKRAIEGQGKMYTFPYAVFERAVLSQLREIDPAEITAPVPQTEVSVLQGELNWLRERKATLALELLKGNVAELADALRQLKAREDELAAEIEDGAELVAVPREDAWHNLHTLTDLLDQTPPEELEDVRLRLRAALRRIVSGVWLLVMSRGRDRLCGVQVFFADGGCRHYVILYRPGHANANARREGAWWVESFAKAALPDTLDLRNRDHAVRLETVLSGVDLNALTTST